MRHSIFRTRHKKNWRGQHRTTVMIRVAVGVGGWWRGGYTVVEYSVDKSAPIGNIPLSAIRASVWKVRTRREADQLFWKATGPPTATFYMNHADLSILRDTPPASGLQNVAWDGFTGSGSRAATVIKCVDSVLALTKPRDSWKRGKRRFKKYV